MEEHTLGGEAFPFFDRQTVSQAGEIGSVAKSS